MVEDDLKVFLIENDHKFQQYCKEKGFSPNNVPMEDFMNIASEIGWVMTYKDYEMHHNTRTLPLHYYIRFK